MGRYVQPTVQEFDSNGDPLSGGKLYFYTTETLTAKDTYSDSDLTTANTNPVVADAGGRFGNIFLGSGTYRVILKDSDDVTIYDRDPVDGAAGNSGAVDEITDNYSLTSSDATKVLSFDTTDDNYTLTLLPAATAGEGFEVTVQKSDSGSNTVTIDGSGAETIDGSATLVLSLRHQSVTIRSDGSNWIVIVAKNFGSGAGFSDITTIPIGGVIDYGGTSAPTNYIFPYGQAISRTTYADLFAILGTTFGVGDGSTTFNVPDLRGRVTAGKDDMGGTSADRLTDAYSGGLDGDVLGDTGGEEAHLLTGNETGTSSHTHGTGTARKFVTASSLANDDFGSGSSTDGGLSNGALITNVAASAEADAAQEHNNVQPTIIMNKIMRAA